MKWKGSEFIWYWADCITLPFDHTHDLNLGVSRPESEIALSQEWSDRLTMNEKDVSPLFMTMILICVTMVRWADVPDSDRGDFRRRRAVDISSLYRFYSKFTYWHPRCYAKYGIHSHTSAAAGLPADSDRRYSLSRSVSRSWYAWLMTSLPSIQQNMLIKIILVFTQGLVDESIKMELLLSSHITISWF